MELGGETDAADTPEFEDEAADAPDFDLTPPEAPEIVEEEPEPEADLEEEVKAEEESEVEDEAEPFDLSGMQAGDDMGEEDDDVEGIVDPLAGLRAAEDDADSTSDSDTLDLDGEVAEFEEMESDDGDDLLGEANTLAAEDKPEEEKKGGKRKRAILGDGAESSDAESGSDGGSDGGSSKGTTLFERMANLSRSSESDDDDDEDGDDAPALSIPRFLGRQNNQ